VKPRQKRAACQGGLSSTPLQLLRPTAGPVPRAPLLAFAIFGQSATLQGITPLQRHGAGPGAGDPDAPLRQGGRIASVGNAFHDRQNRYSSSPGPVAGHGGARTDARSGRFPHGGGDAAFESAWGPFVCRAGRRRRSSGVSWGWPTTLASRWCALW